LQKWLVSCIVKKESDCWKGKFNIDLERAT
jgi:hypothetical protein